MTSAQFISFIKSALRNKSRFWKPATDAKKAANVRRGFYLCNICKEEVPKTIVVGGKRVNNIFLDHITPIVDPTTGFTGWDSYVKGLFCEAYNYQVACLDCHNKKSLLERNLARESRNNKKENNGNSI